MSKTIGLNIVIILRNCYHNIMAWQLNNKLRDGWSLVGSDNDSFIIAKNNGI